MPFAVDVSRGIRGWLALIASVAAPAVCVAQPPARAAAEVTIVLDQTVSSRSVRPGDEVRLHTSGDATIGGRFVASGSPVRGTVIHARRAGRMHHPGELAIGEFTIMDSDRTPLAISAAVIRALPPRHVSQDFYARQAAAEGRILTGMAAGYGAAWLTSQWSHSEETVVNAGLLTGVAAVGLMQVLPRGPDLQLSRGATFAFVFDARVP